MDDGEAKAETPPDKGVRSEFGLGPEGEGGTRVGKDEDDE